MMRQGCCCEEISKFDGNSEKIYSQYLNWELKIQNWCFNTHVWTLIPLLSLDLSCLLSNRRPLVDQCWLPSIYSPWHQWMSEYFWRCCRPWWWPSGSFCQFPWGRTETVGIWGTDHHLWVSVSMWMFCTTYTLTLLNTYFDQETQLTNAFMRIFNIFTSFSFFYWLKWQNTHSWISQRFPSLQWTQALERCVHKVI